VSDLASRPKKKKSKNRWRPWLRALHRDFGYFFAGATLLYAVSGLMVNHSSTWNPDFDIKTRTVPFSLNSDRDKVTEEDVIRAIESIEDRGEYRGHDWASDLRLKVYFDDGSLVTLLGSDSAEYETVRRRELVLRVNKLHLHPTGWWLLFSDAFSAALAFLAISGLFLLKGKNGFLGRGKWLAAAGLFGPLLGLWLGG
jgi:hypothetical protein